MAGMLVDAVSRFADFGIGLSEADLARAWKWGAYDSEGVRFGFFRTMEDVRELTVRLIALRAGRVEDYPPLTQAQRILGQYQAAYRDMQAAVLGLTPEQMVQPPAENEWPVRRVLAHMAAGDIGFAVAVGFALERARQGLPPAAIPDEAWEARIGLSEEAYRAIVEGPADKILAQHAVWHARILAECSSIADAELEVPSNYWEATTMPVRFRLHRFESHLRQHTVQLDKTIAAIGAAPGEARRLVCLIYAALAEAEAALIGAPELGSSLQAETASRIDQRTAELRTAVTG